MLVAKPEKKKLLGIISVDGIITTKWALKK
jgi:hypothetical protein